MKAYAVLSGGGVKGAALAGCLAGSEDQGIEFVGYGGTSAGALVSTLACVGYEGSRIGQLMMDRLHPRRFLDDSGEDLEEVRKALEEVWGTWSRSGWTARKMWKTYRVGREQRAMTARLARQHGLYSGAALKRVLYEAIRDIMPDVQQFGDITFEQLADKHCPVLKIVASDLHKRCAAVYGSTRLNGDGGGRLYSNSVLEAVRASTAYPMVFAPCEMADGTRLVDGGLASNLPSFLFREEQSRTNFPVILFDLVVTRDAAPRKHTLPSYAMAIAGAALDAGDDLMAGIIPGVRRIPVPLSADIEVLGFNVTSAQLEGLYNAGYAATSRSLSAWDRLQMSRSTGADLQRELWSHYGDRKLVEPVLWAIKSALEGHGARDVRVSVMLPTGRKSGSRIVTYSHGFRPGDADRDLELGEHEGCSGLCVQERRAVVVNLEQHTYPSDYRDLRDENKAKVPRDRRAMISLPVFGAGNGEQVSSLPIRGVLSLDTSSSLEEVDLRNSMLAASLTSWTDILARVMR